MLDLYFTNTYVYAQFQELSKGKGYITEKALRKWDELQEIKELGTYCMYVQYMGVDFGIHACILSCIHMINEHSMYVCVHTYRIFTELASEEVVESYFSRIDIRDGKIDLPNFKKFISMLGSFSIH